MLQHPDALLKETSVENPVQAKDGIVAEHDPLMIEIEDNELVRVLDKRIEDSEKFFEKRYNLSTRRERNERYLMGRQVSTAEKSSKIKPYEARYQDNALYEIEASIKPAALSRMPDMMVLPGQETPQSQENAENLTKIIDSDIKKREHRQVLALAFKHLPVYFTGIIKIRWNPELGKNGDYEFLNIHPENVVIDEQCASKDGDKMSFIAEAMKLSAQDVIMRFPEAEAEFMEELRKDGVKIKEGEDWKLMATPVKIFEVWFTWYKKKDQGNYERIEGLLWKYGDVILKKMRNPNYDYEGRTAYFTYETPGDTKTKTEIPPDLLMQSAFTGVVPPGVEQEMVYRNYFSMPRKPYYFMGYDQWGKIGYDETSRIEQNIYNQENIDKIGKRIIEKLKDRGKHIFSKESGLTGKDIERMDLNNPDQDILAEGDVNKVHGFIPPIEPTQQEFGELKLAKERMFSLAGATNLTGILQSDTATSNQIAREANYSRVDDLAEDTINAASEWMSEWVLQMIKLRYTEEHLRKVLGGAQGSATFISIKGDMVEDGVEIRIKSSGTDKVNRQRNAMEMAKAKLIDPLTFYKDMDMSDPEGRAEKLMMMQLDPQGYFMKFIMKMTPTQGAQAIMGQPPVGAPAQAPTPVNPSPEQLGAIPTQPPPTIQGSPEVL